MLLLHLMFVFLPQVAIQHNVNGEIVDSEITAVSVKNTASNGKPMTNMVFIDDQDHAEEDPLDVSLPLNTVK